MKKYLLLALLWAFFGLFLFYPVFHILRGAFLLEQADGSTGFTLRFFSLVFENEVARASFFNSLLIACWTTGVALALALPLALLFNRCTFPGRRFFDAAMLVPLILPPFVGAIGIKHFFARFGSINLLLDKAGLVPIETPIDWFGAGGFAGIILMEVLHLFPILYLSTAAALANIDPSLRDAARNLGADPLRVLRTVTIPLAMPGIFAGCSIVFIAAFTDLGTPLIFDFRAAVPVQIFTASTETATNPAGYALVVLTLLLVTVLFLAGRALGGSGSYAMMGRAASHETQTELRGPAGWLAALGVGALLFAAVLPHLGVILSSFAERWFFTILPTETTTAFYGEVFTHDVTASSIRNSLVYSVASAGLDLILGVAIAWLLAREKFFGKAALDAIAMLPLALPGLVLAFGYVAAFNLDIPWLNPRTNPTLLLVISYSVRRLPYIVRAAYAGLQQTSVSLEEASLNLGASRWTTLRRITIPLIAANLVAGTVLTFSFAMLEVSDSLILAMESRFAPITKGIYELLGRPNPEAASLACALGVLAMLLLAASLGIASRVLGKKMGQLFRA